MISRLRLAAYAGPALPLAALGLPVYIQLPAFYAGDMGLGMAATGGALLASRLVDFAADPIIGLFCDGGSGRRRRGWILSGLPVLLVAGWHLFLPAAGVGALYLLGWSAAFYLGFTLIFVPYQAWGAELSADYAERTRIAGWREGFGLGGVLLAVVAPAVLDLSRPRLLAILFLPAALILFAAVMVAALLVPERPSMRARRTGMPAQVGMVLGNRPFRRLILAQAMNATANAFPASLFLLFVGDALGRPDLAGPLLLAYFVAAIAGIPGWLALAERLGKHRAWRLSLAFTALSFAPVPFLAVGQWPAFSAVCLLTGVGLSADLTLPPAILADVMDEHAAEGGGGRAGLYVALWGLTAKLALALAVGVAFPVLALAGFKPGAANSNQALALLGLLYAGGPVVLKLAAVAVLHRFPLDSARHRELQRRIALLSEG